VVVPVATAQLSSAPIVTKEDFDALAAGLCPFHAWRERQQA
jgi:hypothetical protein